MSVLLSDFQNFLIQLKRLGLEEYRRYYGPYRAFVVDNRDPAKQGRIRVECPRAKLPKENREWVLPMMHGAGNDDGIFWPPEEEDTVWIFFDNGDPTKPLCYSGGWYGPGEVDEEFESGDDNVPQKRGFTTPGGHRIILDDTDGEEKITIRHKDGTIIQWTETNKVKVGNEDGTFEPLVRGNAWKRWAETHSHPHSWGPTGQPIQPIPSDVLSSDTETS